MIDTLRFILAHPMNKRRPLQALAGYFLWQIRSRIAKDIHIKWIGGTTLIVNNGMTGATGNIYCGLHEFADMVFVIHFLRPGDLFLDIGANIGSYTILSSGLCGANTIAFEPDPDTARFLRRNITSNRLDEAVLVRELALSNEDGEISFTVGQDTINHVAEAGDALVRRVPAARLDSIPEAAGAVLMKLDVEGFEEQVLTGATGVLQSPTLLAIESEGQGSGVEAILYQHGFVRAYYNPMTRELSAQPTPYAASNGLYIRDKAAVEARVKAARTRAVNGFVF